jgi:predicted acetyltransferase
MTIDIRPCASREELKAAVSPIWHFFGSTPTDERLDRFAAVLPPERMLSAHIDGAVAGGAGAFPFELTVPGGRVQAAGVTVVGVYPTHRRRGVLRAMMRAQLDQVHELGEPVAYLWASEETIYGRFGYGIASLAGDIDIPRNRTAFGQAFEPGGNLRLIDTDEAMELIPPVYESVAVETPGMFARTPAWWEARVLSDPEFRRGGGGELQRVVLEIDGRVEAYALYRLHMSFEAGLPSGYTSVIEAMGATADGTRAIWRFLFDVDWMNSIRASLLPVDHPLLFLVAEPRRLGFRIFDGLWVRLVDVGAALGARSYTEAPSVVLEVLDSFCPWNDGRYEVPGGERTDAEPDLRVDVAALGSAYLGGFTFAELARALRVEELASGALARADTLFGADRAPWCPEIF